MMRMTWIMVLEEKSYAHVIVTCCSLFSLLLSEVLAVGYGTYQRSDYWLVKKYVVLFYPSRLIWLNDIVTQFLVDPLGI